MSATAYELEPQLTEEQTVQRWEYERLIELGYDRVTAAFAALNGVQWHDVASLIAAGCSHATALEIVQ